MTAFNAMVDTADQTYDPTLARAVLREAVIAGDLVFGHDGISGARVADSLVPGRPTAYNTNIP